MHSSKLKVFLLVLAAGQAKKSTFVATAGETELWAGIGDVGNQGLGKFN
jgi:hypothetical protein